MGNRRIHAEEKRGGGKCKDAQRGGGREDSRHGGRAKSDRECVGGRSNH